VCVCVCVCVYVCVSVCVYVCAIDIARFEAVTAVLLKIQV
jgi:hypothetical protein